jgi:integration host factor subunit beta
MAMAKPARIPPKMPTRNQPESDSLILKSFSEGKVKMTKADLVERVAKEADMTKKDAEQLVEIIFDSIIASLNKGEKIELRGFGSFRVRQRNARKGRNPKTGDSVNIPAKRVAYFKPGKELKEVINEGK